MGVFYPAYTYVRILTAAKPRPGNGVDETRYQEQDSGWTVGLATACTS